MTDDVTGDLPSCLPPGEDPLDRALAAALRAPALPAGFHARLAQAWRASPARLAGKKGKAVAAVPPQPGSDLLPELRELFAFTLETAIATQLVESPQLASDAQARFARLVDGFYEEYAARYPTDATDLGLHQHDGALEDLSPAGLAARGVWLRAWDERFGQLRAAALSPVDALARE